MEVRTTKLRITGISETDQQTIIADIQETIEFHDHLQFEKLEKIGEDYLLTLSTAAPNQELGDRMLQEEVWELLSAITTDSEYSVIITK